MAIESKQDLQSRITLNDIRDNIKVRFFQHFWSPQLRIQVAHGKGLSIIIKL